MEPLCTWLMMTTSACVPSGPAGFPELPLYGPALRFADSLPLEMAAEKTSAGYIYSRCSVSCLFGVRMWGTDVISSPFLGWPEPADASVWVNVGRSNRSCIRTQLNSPQGWVPGSREGTWVLGQVTQQSLALVLLPRHSSFWTAWACSAVASGEKDPRSC